MLPASCSRQPSLDDVLERLPSEDLLLERPARTATATADAIADAATARVLVRSIASGCSVLQPFPIFASHTSWWILLHAPQQCGSMHS